MENLKHTKEYAEKLAKEKFPDTTTAGYLDHWSRSSQRDFVIGYMKAIEETNVTELISALQDAQSLIEKHFPNDLTILDKIANALTNSTK